MKTLSTILILIAPLVGLAQAPKMDDSKLASGQCYSLPDTKNYLSGLQSRSASFTKVINEIGRNKVETLKDDSSDVYYFCKIRCKTQSGNIDSFWITQTDSPSRFLDMDGFVCAGVSIENVQIVGSVYGLQPVVSAYWSYETNFSEVHDWLTRTKFILPHSAALSQYAMMHDIFNYIAGSYFSSTSPILKEAGLMLAKLVDGSAEGKILLRSYVAALKLRHWEVSKNLDTSEYFILSQLKTYGRFLEYDLETMEL